jgi:alpha 1,2-mannosyltransferase
MQGYICDASTSDLYGAVSTVQQMEDRFNRPFEYPYVFLNDKPFSDRFKDVMRRVSKGRDDIFNDTDRALGLSALDLAREDSSVTRVTMKNAIHGSSESYRHMCR